MRQPVAPPCSQHELLALLSYDAETGEVRWLVSGRRNKAGEIAGHFNVRDGHRRVGINKRLYYASQLIWYMVTGHWPQWPDEYVDHRETYGPKLDIGNRWGNLRIATPGNNQWNRRLQYNNTTGYPGVKHEKSGSWSAQIKKDYVCYRLGTFRSREAAIAARKAAEHEMYGAFRASHPDPSDIRL